MMSAAINKEADPGPGRARAPRPGRALHQPRPSVCGCADGRGTRAGDEHALQYVFFSLCLRLSVRPSLLLPPFALPLSLPLSLPFSLPLSLSLCVCLCLPAGSADKLSWLFSLSLSPSRSLPVSLSPRLALSPSRSLHLSLLPAHSQIVVVAPAVSQINTNMQWQAF